MLTSSSEADEPSRSGARNQICIGHLVTSFDSSLRFFSRSAYPSFLYPMDITSLGVPEAQISFIFFSSNQPIMQLPSPCASASAVIYAERIQK